MRLPRELYTPSTRPYSAPEEPDYPFHDRAVRVTQCGRICIGKRKINLSTVFAGRCPLALSVTQTTTVLGTGTEEILTRATLRNMQRVHWMDPVDPESAIRGLVFSHMTIGTTPVVGHGGYCLGHRAQFVMDNAGQIAVSAMVNANDINPSILAAAVYGVTAEALKAAREAEPVEDDSAVAQMTELQQLEGVYRWPGDPSGFYIIPKANGEIEQMDLFSDDPAESTRSYRQIDGDLFRRLREDGDLDEDLLFERNNSGEIVSILSEGYRFSRY